MTFLIHSPPNYQSHKLNFLGYPNLLFFLLFLMLYFTTIFIFFFLRFLCTNEIFSVRLFILLLLILFRDDEILSNLPRELLDLVPTQMIFLVFGFLRRMMILRWLVLRVMMLFLLVPSIFFLVLARLCRIQGFCLILLQIILFNFLKFFDFLFI